VLYLKQNNKISILFLEKKIFIRYVPFLFTTMASPKTRKLLSELSRKEENKVDMVDIVNVMTKSVLYGFDFT